MLHNWSIGKVAAKANRVTLLDGKSFTTNGLANPALHAQRSRNRQQAGCTHDRRRCLSGVIRFKSSITIWKGEENFSAASLLEVLTANLDCGARVVFEAVGPHEQEALNELEALLLRFRDEEGRGLVEGRAGVPEGHAVVAWISCDRIIAPGRAMNESDS
jgi:phosphotransferase system HPr-like phosphotransfer protein